MWIELSDEIIEYAKEIKSPFDKGIIALNSLFDSMLKQHHVVFGSIELLDYLRENEMISLTNRKFIEWIMQKYVYIYEASDIVEYKILVTLEGNCITREGKNFFVPIKFLYEVRETKLLAEHESDAQLFRNIFLQMYNKKKLSKNYDIRFENDSFHGANAPSKLKQAAMEQRIMLCLIDSDKDYDSAASGATYKGANNVYKKIKNKNIVNMRQLGVREKENLFSPDFYSLVSDDKKILLEVLQTEGANDNAIKYFDIKEGIKYKNVNLDSWKEHYNGILEECKKRGIYVEPPEELENKEQHICVEGIGGRLCDAANEILLSTQEDIEKYLHQYAISKEKEKEIYECRKDVIGKLPVCLQEEWCEIFKVLFSWGCCLSSKMIPVYDFN